MIRAGPTPHTMIVTGNGTFGSLGHVKFSATFAESLGIDTISLTSCGSITPRSAVLLRIDTAFLTPEIVRHWGRTTHLSAFQLPGYPHLRGAGVACARKTRGIIA